MRCSSFCATSTTVDPVRRQIASTVANSSRTSAAGPSSSTISTVSAGGKFGCTAASAARIASASIISTAAGTMPAAMISDTAAPASLVLLYAASSVCTRLRLPQDADDDLRHDRQRAFAADQQAEQIRTRRVGQRAADAHELAVGHHGLDLEHVVHGEAVLQAMRAAGVLGDVAADRAHLLARRIGRVVVAERRDLPRDLEVGDARLHGHALVRRCRRRARDSAAPG